MHSDEHRFCELRYRELLDRLDDMAERLDRVERDRRTFLDVLRDFWDLIRLVVDQVKVLHHRVEGNAVQRIVLPMQDERDISVNRYRSSEIATSRSWRPRAKISSASGSS